ncbi:MAG: methyltransferase domain-containing protein, partial [Pseudomonadota bacterium]
MGELLLGGADDRNALRWLDVVCGNGGAMQHAFDASLRSNRAVSIVGIDNSHAALAELRTRFPQACSVLADAKSIPFRDGSFDVAFSQFG